MAQGTDDGNGQTSSRVDQGQWAQPGWSADGRLEQAERTQETDDGNRLVCSRVDQGQRTETTPNSVDLTSEMPVGNADEPAMGVPGSHRTKNQGGLPVGSDRAQTSERVFGARAHCQSGGPDED